MNSFISKNLNLVALALLVGWDVLLVATRMKITGRITFQFFIWNLFLAILPYLFALVAVRWASAKRNLPAWAALVMSILFLPNAPYIITDLFHLRSRAEMPLWFDTLLIFSFAWSGLLLYYGTTWELRRLFQQFWGKITAELILVLLAFLCGFGIYLGRYLRFNSWDVLSNPNDLVDEISSRRLHPTTHLRTVGVTLLYGAFLLVGDGIIRLLNGYWKRN